MLLPVAIILASIIFGGFFYASQVSKQKSIENQQLTDQQAKWQKGVYLDTCLSDAENSYNAKLANDKTMDNNKDIPAWSPEGVALANQYQNDRDACFKQYPQQ